MARAPKEDAWLQQVVTFGEYAKQYIIGTFGEYDFEWSPELNLFLIEQEMKKVFIRLGIPCDDIDIDEYDTSFFNRIFNIEAHDAEADENNHRFILRISPPIYPFYKVESEVATMEFLRAETNVPVPLIYAFDSSMDNKFGYEWVLMEEAPGETLSAVLLDMEPYEQRRIFSQIKRYRDEILAKPFHTIGSIFCDWAYLEPVSTQKPAFYIGRAVQECYATAFRSLYADVMDYGPHGSIRDYFLSFLKVKLREFSDPAMHELGRANESINKRIFSGFSTTSDQAPISNYAHVSTWALTQCRSRAESTAPCISTKAPESRAENLREESCKKRQLSGGTSPGCRTSKIPKHDNENVKDSKPFNPSDRYMPGYHWFTTQDITDITRVIKKLTTFLESDILFPSSAETSTTAPLTTHLHHHDLHSQNILVDPKTYAITAILDWEFCHCVPKVLHRRPKLADDMKDIKLEPGTMTEIFPTVAFGPEIAQSPSMSVAHCADVVREIARVCFSIEERLVEAEDFIEDVVDELLAGSE